MVQQQDGSKWDNLCPLLKDLAHFDCDVGNICLLLKNIKKCPKVVLDAGWNCKCPMKAVGIKLMRVGYVNEINSQNSFFSFN